MNTFKRRIRSSEVRKGINKNWKYEKKWMNWGCETRKYLLRILVKGKLEHQNGKLLFENEKFWKSVKSCEG